MPDLFGLGGLLGTPESTGDSQQASLAEGWKQVLSNPTTQAALLNFGGQLLKPRWNPGSALPDAMGAAGQTVAVNEAEDYKRAEAQRDNARQETNASANRKNQLDIANINADQRATAAELRASTAIKQAELRGQLTSAARTPAEDKFFREIYANHKKIADAAVMVTKETPEQIDRAATEAANNALTAYRARFGAPTGGGTVGPGSEKTSPPTSGNPANGKPSALQSQSGAAGEKTSVNSETVLRLLEAKDPNYMTNLTPAQKKQLTDGVADPQNLPWNQGSYNKFAPIKKAP